jgi:hypothetical protein
MKHKNYTVPASIMMQKIDDEALLMDANTHLFYELNPTAAVLWEIIQRHNHMDDVITEMLEYFEVTPEELEQDLKRFMLSLQEQGMILFEHE